MWDKGMDKSRKKKKGTWDRERTKNKFCSAHKGGGVRAVSCAFMMIFHPEQTSWASQREESIDLPGSNHNTSTFPQVYFLAFYQDFINYFGWQIDLLPPPLCWEKGDLIVSSLYAWVCACLCKCMSVCAHMCVHAHVRACVCVCVDTLAWVFVCRLLRRHHLPSGLKVQGPHGGKANVTGQANQCQVPTNDVRRSPHCHCPNKQPFHRVWSPPDPLSHCRFLVMMAMVILELKLFLAWYSNSSHSGFELNPQNQGKEMYPIT